MKKIFNHIPFQVKVTVTFLYLGIIVLLSLLPVKDLPKVPLFPGADKLIHAGMYFVLSILILWSFHTSKVARWKLYGFVIGWGLLMEILQILMRSGRQFSLLDIIANATGVVLGIALYKVLNTQLKLQQT
ncbi:VanZ family protein [Sunxiuqinia sp. sy24]|uniref:VanZ family protein n=1 Tax=Sunxiuqinia sp. sy24 TaxID=3461495 RepID=UPI0040460F69